MDLAMDLVILVEQCAPTIHPQTITAVIDTESDLNPLAINVNGLPKSEQPTPKTPEEAVRIATELLSQGHNIDMGLGQINSENVPRLGLTIKEIFDPCTNLQAAETILRGNYISALQRHEPGSPALNAALSAYNTGDEQKGMKNGYVQRVRGQADYVVPALHDQAPVILQVENQEKPPGWDVFSIKHRPQSHKEWSVFK